MTTRKTRKSYKPEFKAAVVEEYLQGEHLLSEIAAAHEVHPNLILKWKKAAMAALPDALDETAQKSLTVLKAQHEKEVEQLHAQIGRLTMKLVWLKKKCESMVSRSTRMSEIEWTNEQLSIKEQAELLRLNRTGLYYKVAPVSERELLLRRRIDEIFTAWPFYGSRRIRAVLQREGWQINRKAVQRVMGEMGLEAIRPKPNLSRPGEGATHKKYPYLLRGLKLLGPNHVQGLDITYIRLKRGWLYLVAVLDWYSRYIVSWELSDTLQLDFVITAVKRGLLKSKPTILNSDQGSHFTSPQYTKLVEEAGVQISMDGRGRAFDNIFTERLWRTIK